MGFVANLVGAGQTAAMRDFLKWYEEVEAPPKWQYQEGQPPYVPNMTDRWGVFGEWASQGGLDGSAQLPSCADVEAQPMSPCQATGECHDLLELGRKFTEDAHRTEQLMSHAMAALTDSRILLQRAAKGAEAMVNARWLSHFSADEPPQPGGSNFQSARILVDRMLRPPVGLSDVPTVPETEGYLERLEERWAFDRRINDYLRNAERDGPLTLPLVVTSPPRPFPILSHPMLAASASGLAAAALLAPTSRPRARRAAAAAGCRRSECGRGCQLQPAPALGGFLVAAEAH